MVTRLLSVWSLCRYAGNAPIAVALLYKQQHQPCATNANISDPWRASSPFCLGEDLAAGLVAQTGQAHQRSVPARGLKKGHDIARVKKRP